MRYSLRSRTLSLMLTVALLFQLFGVSAHAATDEVATSGDLIVGEDITAPFPDETIPDESPLDTSAQVAEDLRPESAADSGSAYVVNEVTALRSETGKHFRLSDGTFIAVSYGQPVHYQDENGTWQDIDNTLTTVSRAPLGTETANTSVQLYEATYGDQVRQFAATWQPGVPLFAMESGQYGLSMSAVVPENNSVQSLGLDTELIQESPVSIQVAVEPTTVDLTTLTEAERETISLSQQVVPAASGPLVTYADVWPGVSLVYQTEGYTVKESIIISAPQASYVYDFSLELTGLTPTPCEDGTIALSADSGEVIYRIPAPFMEDANGSYSDDVTYTLTQRENGWRLTVTADAQWLNDPSREYPVVIDPSVYLEGDGSNRNIITAYVNSNYPTSRPGDVTMNIRAGYCPSSMDASTYGTSLGLVYIKNLPAVPEGCVITSSTLNLYETASYGETRIELFGSVMNTGYTPESFMGSVTWNTLTAGLTYGGSTAKASRTALDYEPTIQPSPGGYNERFWDITSLVQDWYTDQNDPSSRILVLEAMDGATTTSNPNAYPDGRATYSGYTGGHKPQIIVHYQHTAGVEGIYSYHTQSMGRAGTGYVNDFTLGLTVANTILTSNSEVTPFALTLYYNSIAGDQQWTASTNIHSEDYSTSMTGAGWKTSVQQSVVQETLTGDNSTTDTYLIYMDADGTEHYFWKSGSTYYDEDGLGLSITKSGSTYTMTDKGNNTWEFYNGYLTKQTDSHGNMILYGYDGVAVTSATTNTWKPQNTTSAHRVTSVYRKNASMTTPSLIATLEYNSDGYLTTITDHNGYETTLHYDWLGGPLVLKSITFPDGQTASYTYDGGYRLESAYDNEAKCGIRYTYANMQGQKRVSQITMYEGTTNTDGTTMLAQKINGTYTRFQYAGTNNTIGDSDDLVEYYTFDNWGRAINLVTLDSAEEDIYGVSAGTYTQNSGTSATNNRMTGAASGGIQGVNLLKNSGLELGAATNWTKGTGGSMAVAANTNTPSPRTIYPRTGNYLLKLHLPTGSAADALCTVYQSMYLKAGETYVFSGYVNTACSSVFSDEGGAYLSILNSGNEEQKASRMINHKTNANIEDGWERLEVTFSPKTSGTYRLAANWKGSSQVVAFDDFQMERVVETAREDETTEEETTPVGAASGVNLLQMGGFQFVGSAGSATTSGYSTYWGEDGDTSSFSLVNDATRGGYVLKMTVYPSTKFRYSQTVNIGASSNSTYILSGWGKATSAMNNGLPMTGDNASEAPFFGFIVKIVYADSSLEPEYQYVSFNHDCTDWQYVTGVIVPEEKEQTVSTMTVSLAYDYNINYALFDDVSLVQEPVQTYSYDDEGNMITASDSENAQTSAEYDSSDRLTGYTTMSGVSYALTYSGTSRDPATITSDGVRTTYTYTANGQVSRESTSATSGGKALVTSYGFDENGDFTTSTNDVNGNGSSLAYDPYTRQVARTTDAAENQVFYQYNSRNGRPTTIYQTGVAALTFGYENGSQTSVNRKSFRTTDGITTTNWQRYYTQLNQWGLPTSVTVSSSTDGESWSGGITLTQNEYDNGYGNLVKKTMANGQCVEYHYDSLDRLVKTVYYSSTGAVQTSHVYVYNAQGQLSAQYATDANGSVIERYFYEYDSLGRLICSRELDGEEEPVQRVMQCYDTANRLVSQRWHIGERGFTETYSYNAGDGSLSSISSPMGETITLSYDALKRNTGHTVTKSGTELFKNTWNYWDRTDNTTLTTAQVRYFNYRDADAGLIQGWMYAYDARGNISTIYESETPYRVLAKYEYDSLNQLTKETTYTYSGTSTTATSTTVNTFTYDTAGNLLTASNNGITSRYTYGDNNWTDLLTKFKGVTINYDGSGNPTNWYNGTSYSNLTWERGRQLTSIKKGTNTYTYDYDMSGVRSSKTVNGVVHNYVTQSGKVVLETYGDYMLFFVYDQNGRPFALRYSTNDGSSFTTCYYILNLQGDVVALYNTSGIIAKYSYDAWGKLLSVTNANGTSITSSSHIANINPLRYRGYYYDAETGFYYLQSRYYDPAVKRFINADALPSTGQEFAGYNMFAYCGNNPVTRSDIQGTSWKDFVEEMDRRFVHCMKTIGRIVTSPFKALSAEAGVGVGLGVDAKVNACGIPLEVGAVASVSDSVVYDKGKFDVRSRTSTSFAFNLLKVFGFSYTQGHEHSYFDEQCTCNAWEDSYGEKSECPANEPFEEGSSIISFSAGVYLVLGFNLSVSFDLAAWGDELTSIYYDSVNYGK